MTINSIDFFHSAKKEVTQKGEIHSRNAMSRAYYSAYHLALSLNKFIPDHLGIAKDVGVHEKFISKLTCCPVNSPSTMLGIKGETAMKIRSLGVILKTAKSARHKADYHLSSDIEKEEAEAQLELTEKIFEKINEVTTLLSPDETAKVKSI